MDVGLGLTAQAQVDVGDYSFKDNAPYSLLHTSFALPTACMSFDARAKSYAPAAATATTSATGSAAAAKGHSGGAAGAVNPFGAQGAGLRGMMLLSGLMVLGTVCFVVL